MLDVVRQPLDRKGMGINNAKVEIKKGLEKNSVEIICIEDCPYISPENAKKMCESMLDHFGLKGVGIKVTYDYCRDFILAAAVEVTLRRQFPDIPHTAAFHIGEPIKYPSPDRKRPLRRSHLYIPGSDAYMVGKGGSSGADGVILDLEDAVDPTQKDFARVIVRHALRGTVDFKNTEKMIRINGVVRAIYALLS